MRHPAFHRDHDAFLHLVADHLADPDFPACRAGGCCGLIPDVVAHDCFTSVFADSVACGLEGAGAAVFTSAASRSRRSVLMRAMSRRTVRTLIGLSSWLVASWNRRFARLSSSSDSRFFSSCTESCLISSIFMLRLLHNPV